MPSVNYYFRGSQTHGNITVRFIHTRDIDVKYSTSILVPKKSWDKKRQRVKNVGDMKIAGKLNEKLIGLEAHILASFNLAYIEGNDINSSWLKKSILKFFNRPAYEIQEKEKLRSKIFFIDFCSHFIESEMKSGKWKDNKKKKKLSKTVIGHYEKFLEFFKDYSTATNQNFKIRDIGVEVCNEFCEFLSHKKYGQNYISRQVTRLRFFCARADEKNLEVNKEYRSSQFSAPTEKTHDTYLNEKEINQVFNLDLSDNDRLDNTRDWFIIGLHTGLRVSDFLDRLTEHNFKDGFIHIETKKTEAPVAIPIHSKIQKVLDKRNGELPRRISSVKFNKYVKEVCEAAEINEMIKTSITENGRKKIGMHPKWKAISSHTCRRSFATNHYGEIPTPVIMKIGGWKTESAFLKYLKKSDIEYAKQLQQHWKSKELKKIK